MHPSCRGGRGSKKAGSCSAATAVQVEAAEEATAAAIQVEAAEEATAATIQVEAEDTARQQ